MRLLWGWFDASEAERLGSALADIAAAGFPGHERRNPNKSIAARAKVLENLFEQARQFKQTKKPNIYKKAKLGNAFKWKLLEQGFEPEFVNDLTNKLLVQMK